MFFWGVASRERRVFNEKIHSCVVNDCAFVSCVERGQATIRRLVFSMVLMSICILPAHAEVKDLNVIIIPGYHAVPIEKIPEVYAIASHYFKEVGVAFRVKYLTKEHPCPDFHSYVMWFSEIKCFSSDARKNGYTRKKKLTYYMTAPYGAIDKPISEGGVPYFLIGGITERLGGVVAMGNAEEFNQDGAPRITESGVILAHEVYHMMTATHQPNAINLMHPNALIYVKQGEWLPVLRSSKRQVRRFLIKEK